MATKSLAKKNQAQVVIPLVAWVNARLEADARIKKLEEKLEPLKKAKKKINNKIIEEFKRRGEYSTRIPGATVSLSVRKTAVVVDEGKVIADLKEIDGQQYISESLNNLFEGLKKDMAAGARPLLEGMEIKETEFVSVRENSKEDGRKIVTGDFKKLERGSQWKME